MKPSIAFTAGVLAAGLASHTASAQDPTSQPANAARAPSALAHPAAPLGRWITESGNLEVEIAPCATNAGSNNTAAVTNANADGRNASPSLCGKVVCVLANRSMSAPGTDMAAADARTALGMTLLSGLRESGDGVYQGEIYNRENAKTYRARLTPAEPDQLLVHGYVGIALFGKTQVWRRPGAADGGAQ